MVASFGCSSFRVGLVSAKPLSPKPGALSYPFSTPLLLSLRWIGAYLAVLTPDVKIMQPIRITLLAALVLIAVSAIACTPASPGRQSKESDNATTTRSTPTLKPGDPTRKLKPKDPVMTLAGTPPAIYLPNPQGTLVPHEAIDPPLTPPVLTSYLKKDREAPSQPTSTTIRRKNPNLELSPIGK